MDPIIAGRDHRVVYRDYTVDQLYGFLGAYELTCEIGARFEYSNLGVGLLGHLLGRAVGSTYEALLAARITRPLGMESTVLAPSTSMRGRLASGHGADLQLVPRFELPGIPAAGALLSTVNDLNVFLAALLGLRVTPLAAAMSAQLETRRPTSRTGGWIALGWRVSAKANGSEVAYHAGGATGFSSYLGFDRRRRAGIVVLNNRGRSSENLGAHLLIVSPTAGKDS
jgi:CubicO group peptidase (beta-lactamase class C family)